MKTTLKLLTAALVGGVIGYAIGSHQRQKTQLTELSVMELNAKLRKLIEIEDYETACVVRDVINLKTKQKT
jgi:protein-arginine kinase activator protein McsA